MNKNNSHGPFDLGAVIFPAADSLVSDLGVNVKDRGLDCLGLVVETRNSKARIYFPRLDLTVWLAHDEMKDVAAEISSGIINFKDLSPTNNPDMISHPSWQGHWWINQLEPIEILETQSGDMQSLWSKEDGTLEEHYSGNPSEQVFKLSLGIEELDLPQWKKLEDLKSQELALVRFLPAGMHKLEVQLFLKQ